MKKRHYFSHRQNLFPYHVLLNILIPVIMFALVYLSMNCFAPMIFLMYVFGWYAGHLKVVYKTVIIIIMFVFVLSTFDAYLIVGLWTGSEMWLLATSIETIAFVIGYILNKSLISAEESQIKVW